METRKLITFQIFDVESKTKFANNSLNLPKTGQLFLGWKQGPVGTCFPKKPQTKKSHATIPLTMQNMQTLMMAQTALKRRIPRNRTNNIKIVNTKHEMAWCTLNKLHKALYKF